MEARIYELREKGMAISSIASIVHMPEVEVRIILGEPSFVVGLIMKAMDGYEYVKHQVVSNQYVKAGIAFLVMVAAKMSLVSIPVVNTVTGVKGVVYLSTVGNWIASIVLLTALAVFIYYALV